MKRLLFAYDEVSVLHQLRSRFATLWQHHWDVCFVRGADVALCALKHANFHVLVADLPDNKRANQQLLQRARREAPHLVTVASRDTPHAETAHLQVSSADSTDARVLEQACAMQMILGDAGARRGIRSLGALPDAPPVYTRLRALPNDASGREEAVRLLSSVPELRDHILELANALGTPLGRVEDVEAAVKLLGIAAVGHSAALFELAAALDALDLSGPHSLRSIQEHSMRVGQVAASLLTGRAEARDAFALAVVHDIGHLVLVKRIPEHYERAREFAQSQRVTMHVAERLADSFTHAEVGSYVLALWGAPTPLVEAVAHHHNPGRLGGTELDALGAVHVADRLLREQDASREADTGEARLAASDLDTAFLDSLDVARRLPEWRQMVATYERHWSEV